MNARWLSSRIESEFEVPDALRLLDFSGGRVGRTFAIRNVSSSVSSGNLGLPAVATRTGIQLETRELSVIVPFQADGRVLAATVQRAISPDFEPTIRRAQELAKERFLWDRQCGEWGDFFEAAVGQHRRTGREGGRQSFWSALADAARDLSRQGTARLRKWFRIPEAMT